MNRRNPFLDEQFSEKFPTTGRTLQDLSPKAKLEIEKIFLAHPQNPFWQKHNVAAVFERAIKTDPTNKLFYTEFLLGAFQDALQNGDPDDWWNDTGPNSITREKLEIWKRNQTGNFNVGAFDISVYKAAMQVPQGTPAPSLPSLKGLTDYMLNNNLITRDIGGAAEKLNLVLEQQNLGAVFWLNKDKVKKGYSDLKDSYGRRWIVVDLITDEGAKLVTKGSGWCTQAGSFYNYLPKTGLVYCYCIDWIDFYKKNGITDKDSLKERLKTDPFEFQITSATHNDEEVGYGSEDGYFQEQKLPNNVVFNFGPTQKVNRDGENCDWLGPLLEPLKKYAKIVQERAQISGGNPILEPLDAYIKNGNTFNETKYGRVNKMYGGKLNVPPLQAIQDHTEELIFLFKNPQSQGKNATEPTKTTQLYYKLRRTIPKNLFQCALALVRSYVVYVSINNKYLNGCNDDDAEKYMQNPRNEKIKKKGNLDTYTSWAHIPKGEYQVTGDGDLAEMRAFAMCKYEVTVEFWLYVMQKTPAGKDFLTQSQPNLPVVYVNWYDCLRFCNELSKMYGLEKVYKIGTGETPEVDWIWSANGFRLPSECEWETAAREPPQRFGNLTMKKKGEDVQTFPTAGMSFTYAGSDDIDKVAWYSGNSQDRAHPVGDPSKHSNGWGLYDMSGNVFEWCYDTYGSYADKKSYPDDC